MQGVISASSARNLGLRRDGHLTSVLLCAGSSGSAMFADMTSPLSPERSPERAIFMPSMSSLPLLEMRSVVNRGILLKNVAYETKFKSSPSSSIRSNIPAKKIPRPATFFCAQLFLRERQHVDAGGTHKNARPKANCLRAGAYSAFKF